MARWNLLARGWPLLALALVVRFGQVLATRGEWKPIADPEDYIRHAISIAHHGTYPDTLLPQGGPTAIRPPLFPYFLGLVFKVSGDSITAGRLAAALLGVVTVALIGLVAERIWGRGTALVSMGIAAVYPPLVLVSGSLLSESIALPLMLAVFLLLLEAGDEPGLPLAAAVGALFALSLLNRPALSILAVPIVWALWQRPRPWLAPLAAFVVAGLMIVPWTIRNAVEFDAFIPISTQSGFLLAGTYNRVADEDTNTPGAYRVASVVPELKPVIEAPGQDENEISKNLGKAGREYATDHPGYVVRVFWHNGLRLLQIDDPMQNGKVAYSFQGIGPDAARMSTVAWWIVAVLGLAGLALGAARRAPLWLWVTGALLLLSVISISGDIRYRAPLEPLFVWGAAYLLVTGTRRGRPPPPTPAPPRRSPDPA